MYTPPFWARLAEGQRQQYQGARPTERAELREIWRGQWSACLSAAARTKLRGWPDALVDDELRKAQHWAELLQWADNADSQPGQLGLALEVA